MVEPVKIKHNFAVTNMDGTNLFAPFLVALIVMICACGVFGGLLCILFFRVPQDNSEQIPEFTLTSSTNNEDNIMNTETTAV